MAALMRLRRSLGQIDASAATAGDPGSPLSLVRILSPVIRLGSILGFFTTLSLSSRSSWSSFVPNEGNLRLSSANVSSEGATSSI